MTVLATYAPAIYDVTEAQEYFFDWEWISADQVEVYEMNDTLGTRTRVSRQDYRIEGQARANDRGPTKEGGNVVFQRAHTSGTDRVVVERNTLIVQLTDMPNVRAFNTRVIEQSLDWVTMICQEMVQRKCLAVTATPISQEIIFGSYRSLPAGSIDYALTKLANIINEISNTTQDCSPTLENA